MNFTCVQGDAVEWLRAQPDNSADLLFTSPPYEAARTYGIGFALKGQAWVDWMVGVVKAAAPKVKGLIAVNCEGQTKNYRYSATPFLLAADLHRAGFNLRKPCVYRRAGIFGGGGPDWLKNDWEPIICITRPGRLPWSDNTACGHPPKFPPGGDPSYRLADGKRKTGPRYKPPALANPGNVIDCRVGGGHMGHDLASENEAPFPLSLAEFFVKSFCPPGGRVFDCFSGSGTTGEAALLHGRKFSGCDVRQSQVELTLRRLDTVTPDMFAAVSQP